jgi:hypothetical protein
VKTDLNILLTTLYIHLDDRIMPALGFSRSVTWAGTQY